MASPILTPVPSGSVLHLDRSDPLLRMRQDVLDGLADPVQPQVPPTYLYDEAGSRLYERITGLEAYYPTRTEDALLNEVAPVLPMLVQPTEVVELGSGSSSKTRHLLDALGDAGPLAYLPVDVSVTMLEASARALAATYPRIRITGLAGRYEHAFEALTPSARRLVVFLGSTLGNFPPEELDRFVARLAGILAPGGQLLVGFDRAAHPRKPAERIRAAYDDDQGLTAAFNLNLLVRLNRELGADFRLDRWAHQASYDPAHHQVAMHLVSLEDQQVHIPGAVEPFRFARGAHILTEISRKFDPEALEAWFTGRGFQPVVRWTDAEELFGLLLLERA